MAAAGEASTQRDGLVTRTVHPVVPPRVDYALTGLGTTLLDTTQALVAWTEAHQDEVAAARAQLRHPQRRQTTVEAGLTGPCGQTGLDT